RAVLQKSRSGAAVPFELGVAAASIDLTRRIGSIDVAASWVRATSGGGGTRSMLVSNGTASSELFICRPLMDCQTKRPISLMYFAVYATLACLPLLSIE